MARVEGYRRVGLAEIYTNLTQQLSNYHGMENLVQKIAANPPKVELTDVAVANMAKEILAEIDQRLIPFDRDEQLYRVLRLLEALELQATFWDHQGLLKSKLEEIYSVMSVLLGAVEPSRYSQRKWMVGSRSDSEIATDLSAYSLELLRTALTHVEPMESLVFENLSKQFMDTAEACAKITRPEESFKVKLVADLRRLTNELEVLALLEVAESETA